MKTNRLLLRWPDRRASPNIHSNRRDKTSARNINRAIALEALSNNQNFALPDGTLSLLVVFFPPDKRRRDDDNHLIMLKAIRDKIFERCGRDDSSIRQTIVEWGQIEKGGAVGLEFVPFENHEKPAAEDWLNGE